MNEKELLEACYTHTRRAADLVSKLYGDRTLGVSLVEIADHADHIEEIHQALMRANGAALEMKNLSRGMKPPKQG